LAEDLFSHPSFSVGKKYGVVMDKKRIVQYMGAERVKLPTTDGWDPKLANALIVASLQTVYLALLKFICFKNHAERRKERVLESFSVSKNRKVLL
jgi:hypothetical protein